MLCPETCLHNNASLQEDFYLDSTEIHGPHVHGRIVQVPNRKTNATDCVIEFDKEKTLVYGLTPKDLCPSIPHNANTKKLLKRGVERANIIDYWCEDKTNIRKNKVAESSETVVATNLTDSGFLGGALNENNERNSISRDPGERTNESDDDSLSDEGSDCEIDVSVFKVDEDEDENGTSPSRDLVDSERENNFMRGE